MEMSLSDPGIYWLVGQVWMPLDRHAFYQAKKYRYTLSAILFIILELKWLPEKYPEYISLESEYFTIILSDKI